MASIINAATSGGLITTADTSGILQLQTAGTTAVTVDASQNVTVVGSLTAAGLSGPHNGTVGATTPSTVVATTVKASTTMGVGGATPSASGSGITFPATQSASTDANTLDDYEEGTFSPVVQGSSNAGTATYSTQVGQYTKIGNRVFYNLRIFYTGGTGTGDIRVGGLPFTSNSTQAGAVGSIYAENLAGTAGYVFVTIVIPNVTYLTIDQAAVGGGAAIATAYDAAANIDISGHYFV